MSSLIAWNNLHSQTKNEVRGVFLDDITRLCQRLGVPMICDRNLNDSQSNVCLVIRYGKDAHHAGWY